MNEPEVKSEGHELPDRSQQLIAELLHYASTEDSIAVAGHRHQRKGDIVEEIRAAAVIAYGKPASIVYVFNRFLQTATHEQMLHLAEYINNQLKQKQGV